MKRCVLDDGRWFDADKAEKFAEGTRWDGRNHISLATGSQWDHEELFRTAGGIWVLEQCSQYQHVPTTYQQIDKEAAARWLVANEHEPHQDCQQEYQDLEIA